MNKKMPRTPFSTHLSRSARETEIRIRNIFSGPKKRPPFLLIMLTVLVILLCGNLVAFRQLPAEPILVMETQYYDDHGNYLEIPALALPAGEKNEAVEAINEALNGLRQEYAQLDSWTGGSAWDNHCLFYPSTTGRYLNLLFFQDYFKTDLNTGHVFSLVYDKKEGELVSAEDALALAGLNEKALLDQVAEWEQSQLDREYQEYDFRLTLHDLTLEGFRIKADGQPVFYLTGWVDDVDNDVLDGISGSGQLYIWEDRAVSLYDQYGLEPVPLVPAEETDKLDPPLWNQWYFAGEEPEGGLIQRAEPLDAHQPFDPEVCLLSDSGEVFGPLMSINSSFFAPLIQNTETLYEYGPSYHEEDYWFSANGDGFLSTNYYNPTDGTDEVFLLNVSRTDVSTPRGIRVGDSREAVLAAYPEIYDTQYLGYGGDYLWYCEYEEGFGAALLFFFRNTDTVQDIQLHFLNY